MPGWITQTSEPGPTEVQPISKVPYTAGPTENPRATIVPGQMRSDRQEIPEPFTKADADLAETLEAQAQASRSAFAPMACQYFWPSPHMVCGAILDKYLSLGAENSFLKHPINVELPNPDGIGSRQEFLVGPIYAHPTAGAHPVVNSFMTKWGSFGWEASFLGYPTTDEIVNSDGIGRRQHFQNADIYWHPLASPGANVIGGAIRDKWALTGGEGPTGLLGYPITDEVWVGASSEGRMNRFERGVLYWHPSTGAWPVTGGILEKWSYSGYEAGSWGYPTGDQTTAGSNSSQEFEYGTMSWPVSSIADSDVVDDGEIAPFVGGAAPASTADFYADSQEGVNPNSTLQLVSNQSSGFSQCDPDDCLDDSLLEEPTLAAPDYSGVVLDPRCLDENFNIADGSWRGGRKFACFRYEEPITIISSNGSGQIPVTVTGGVTSSQRSGGFMQEFRIEFGSATGPVGLPTIKYRVSGAGFGSADFRYSGPAQRSLVPQNGSVAIQIQWDAQSMADNTWSTRGTRLEVSFGNNQPGYGATGKRWFDMNTLRCDSTMRYSGGYRQGCVFPSVTPDWVMDASAYPEAVAHARMAISSGLPGNVSRPLHREADRTKRNDNRHTACPKGNDIARDRIDGVPGRSCDEYPFASTKEGANYFPSGRTFNPECHVPDLAQSGTQTGYSVCMIDDPQNRHAGSQLGAFYGNNRVIDGDAFHVIAVGGTLPPAP